MDYYENISKHFQETIECASMAVDVLARPIESSAKLIGQSLVKGSKVMACGFGVDEALAQLFVLQSQSSLREERPGLPMMILPINELQENRTAATLSDHFATALKSLGRKGDILFCVDSCLSESRLIELVNLAISKEIKVVVLSHCTREDYRIAANQDGVCILANAKNRTHLVEIFGIAIQCLASLIDKELFGDNK